MASAQDVEELSRASREGDVDAVRRLVSSRLPRRCCVDVDERLGEWGETALMLASQHSHKAVVECLLEEGADVNATDEGGRSALTLASDEELVAVLLSRGANRKAIEEKLLAACRKGDVAMARLLLHHPSSHVKENVDARMGENEMTPLIAACSFGQMEMALFLLDDVNADVNAKGRDPILHSAKENVIPLLISKGVNVDAVDQFGRTALHDHASHRRVSPTKALIKGGARLDISDTVAGHQVFQLAIYGVYRGYRARAEKMNLAIDVLQQLLQHGAKWDARCQALIDGNDLMQTASPRSEHHVWWERLGPALKFAILLWIDELRDGKPFTQIPGEEIYRGLEATQTYVKAHKASKVLVCRLTICVVGQSTTGKTSLVKSLIKEDVCLESIRDRTIGIDHFKLIFDEPPPTNVAAKRRKHHVSFSDFAGENVYQIMHSLFFPKRALFMITIDLNAYSIAMLRAEMLTKDDAKMQHLMNEHVDRHILSWIRLIFAREPESKFVFVCTKHDAVSTGPGVDESEVMAHVNMMLERVLAILEDMRREIDGMEATDRDEPPMLHLWDSRLVDCPKPTVRTIISCSWTKASVLLVRKEIERLIIESGQSYETPELYTRVLEVLTKKKESAAASPVHLRIRRMFVKVGTLVKELQKEIDGLDDATAKAILESLRDQGDILWYQSMQDTTLQTTVILDPRLLIEFIRQVINHKHATGIAYHKDLSGLPYWKDVSEAQTLVLMMKNLLHSFHLVYPAAGAMAFDSDLIVPFYWKTNIHAVWKFGGDTLGLSTPRDPHEALSRRVHWEFRFAHFIPPALFDLLVVASYGPSQPLELGPDWILYRDEKVAACRVVFDRDWKTHQQSLHLEAVLTDVPDIETRANVLWTIFWRVCSALSCVLKEHSGLFVSSFAHSTMGGHAPSLSSFISSIDQRTIVDQAWMPPVPTLSECIKLVVGTASS